MTAATVEMDAATAALAAGDAGADDRYAVALDRWLALGGADLDARVGQVWADLGLRPGLLDQPTASLSGGEAARAGLAALLLARFDVFLLDEPTNDLDLAGLDRLERWITELGAGVVLVSHDRTFLARTVTDVLELDEFTPPRHAFSGGWQAYLDEREVARRAAWERFEDYDTKRRTLAGRAQREREWATQGLSKAKKSDEPDKNIRAYKINQTEQLAGRAARTEKAIERLDAGRQAARAVAAAAHRRLARAHRRHRRPARRRRGRARRVHARPDRPRRGDGRPHRARRRQRLRQDDAARRGAGSGRARRRDPARSARASSSARSSRPATASSGTATVLRSFQDETGMDAADVRTLLAKFGLVADHVTRAGGDAVAR